MKNSNRWKPDWRVIKTYKGGNTNHVDFFGRDAAITCALNASKYATSIVATVRVVRI